jgi:DnaJ-class molecular chaperone
MSDNIQAGHAPSPERPQPCPYCGGSGVVQGRSVVRGQDLAWSHWCQPCGGTGIVTEKARAG